MEKQRKKQIGRLMRQNNILRAEISKANADLFRCKLSNARWKALFFCSIIILATVSGIAYRLARELGLL